MADFDFENGLDTEPEHLIMPDNMDHKEVGVGKEPPFGELEFLFTGFEDTTMGPTAKMPVAKRTIFLQFEISDTENHKFRGMKHREMVIIGTDDDPNADGGPLKDMDLKKATWKAQFGPIKRFLDAARVAQNKDYTIRLRNAVGINVVGTVQKSASGYRNITAYYAVGTKPLRSLDDQGRPLAAARPKAHADLTTTKVQLFEND